jgi:hypothetical protein
MGKVIELLGAVGVGVSISSPVTTDYAGQIMLNCANGNTYSCS